jgi:hypothetical protein
LIRNDLKARLIISANRAFTGAITKQLRSVTIGFDESNCLMRGYFDSGATVEDKERLDAAFTEVIADLYGEIDKWSFEAVDKPVPEPTEMLNFWVYSRHETIE